MEEFILIKVPAGSDDYFINNVGCLRYSHNQGRESSCIEPQQIGHYLEKGKHVLLGISYLNGFGGDKYVVVRHLDH